MRDLDREKMKMEQQEKKVIMDIKKLAKDNQMDAVSKYYFFGNTRQRNIYKNNFQK